MRSSSSRARALAAGALTVPLCLATLTGTAAPPASPAPGAPEFAVEDVGFFLTNSSTIEAHFFPAINPAGQVASGSRIGSAPAPAARGLQGARLSAARRPRAASGSPTPQPGMSFTAFHAFRTNAALTQRHDLGALASVYSNAFGINFNPTLNSAQVVGETRAPVPGGYGIQAFRYTDGVGMQPLGSLVPNGGSRAYKINSSGQVCGEATVPGGEEHAFRYTDGRTPPMQDLGTLPGGDESRGWSINEAGHVVGDSTTLVFGGSEPSYENHAFLFTDAGGLQPLERFPNSGYSRAYDLNNDGTPRVVGEAIVEVSEFNWEWKAVRWTGTGQKLELGHLPGFNGSRAYGINDSGVIVGSSWHEGEFTEVRAAIWRDKNGDEQFGPDEVEDLNDLIPADTGWELVEATDINNQGQIVGRGFINGREGVFRLTPMAPPDDTPPVLSDCSVTPAARNAAGGDFTLSVRATDNEGIEAVRAEVTGPAGEPQVVTLTRQGVTDVYTGVFTAPANLTAAVQSYSPVFEAVDTSNNTAALSCDPFVVNPNQAPVVVTCSVSPPSRGPAGGTFTITATVTDDLGVSSVTAAVTGPNAIPPVTLALQSGSATSGTYTGAFTAPANATGTAQSYQVQLTATDTRDASTGVNCGTVTVQADTETEPPTIVECRVTPLFLPKQGGEITIVARVTDNEGVTAVRARVQLPGGGTDTVLLSLLEGDRYEGKYTAPANSQAGGVLYTIHLEAEDSSGNTGQDLCGTIHQVRVAGAPEEPGDIRVSPRRLNFGKVKVRQKKRLSFTIRNASADPASLLAFRLGTLRTPFRVVSGPGAQGGPGGLFLVPSGEQRKVVVEFAPTQLGCFEDGLLIQSNDPARPSVTVGCIGKGCRVSH